MVVRNSLRGGPARPRERRRARRGREPAGRVRADAGTRRFRIIGLAVRLGRHRRARRPCSRRDSGELALGVAAARVRGARRGAPGGAGRAPDTRRPRRARRSALRLSRRRARRAFVRRARREHRVDRRIRIRGRRRRARVGAGVRRDVARVVFLEDRDDVSSAAGGETGVRDARGRTQSGGSRGRVREHG